MSAARIVAVATHPIQYHAPWFRGLAEDPDIDLVVLFALLPTPAQQGAGFGVAFEWDVPLLQGYDHEVLDNVSRRPGLDHPAGLDTPGVGAALRRLGPDAVVLTGWQSRSQVQALAAARRHGAPRLMRMEANDLRPRSRLRQWALDRRLRSFEAGLVIGSANRRLWERAGVPPTRLFDAPYFVPTAHLCPDAPRDRAAARAVFGLPSDAPLALFVGKFERKKRVTDLLAAANAVADTGLHVLLVGTGPLESTLRDAADPRRVTFAGFLNQRALRDAYVAADVAVLSSDAGETWGLVVNEAMTLARPAIVSTSVGCAEDLVLPGVTGWRHEVGDVAALAAALREVATDPQEARRRGAAAQVRVGAWSAAAAVAGTRAALVAVGALA